MRNSCTSVFFRKQARLDTTHAEHQPTRTPRVTGKKIKHVPALYLATAMALQGMTKQELKALKLRIEEKRV